MSIRTGDQEFSLRPEEFGFLKDFQVIKDELEDIETDQIIILDKFDPSFLAYLIELGLGDFRWHYEEKEEFFPQLIDFTLTYDNPGLLVKLIEKIPSRDELEKLIDRLNLSLNDLWIFYQYVKDAQWIPSYLLVDQAFIELWFQQLPPTWREDYLDDYYVHLPRFLRMNEYFKELWFQKHPLRKQEIRFNEIRIDPEHPFRQEPRLFRLRELNPLFTEEKIDLYPPEEDDKNFFRLETLDLKVSFELLNEGTSDILNSYLIKLDLSEDEEESSYLLRKVINGETLIQTEDKKIYEIYSHPFSGVFRLSKPDERRGYQFGDFFFSLSSIRSSFLRWSQSCLDFAYEDRYLSNHKLHHLTSGYKIEFIPQSPFFEDPDRYPKIHLPQKRYQPIQLSTDRNQFSREIFEVTYRRPQDFSFFSKQKVSRFLSEKEVQRKEILDQQEYEILRSEVGLPKIYLDGKLIEAKVDKERKSHFSLRFGTGTELDLVYTSNGHRVSESLRIPHRNFHRVIEWSGLSGEELLSIRVWLGFQSNGTLIYEERYSPNNYHPIRYFQKYHEIENYLEDIRKEHDPLQPLPEGFRYFVDQSQIF